MAKLLENLCGEFLDACLGLSPEEAVAQGAEYTLYGGHTIGFWIFIGIVAVGTVMIIFNSKFRKKFF